VELTSQLEAIMNKKLNINEIRSLARREILCQLVIQFREI